MTCPEFDWKGYVLGELEPAARQAAAEHLAGCARCREEVERLELTLSALARLPEREPARRIAFVSDPVFEPGWWQRFWASGARLGFASAAMLALAIVAHGVMARDAAPVAAVSQTEIEQRVVAEVERRLPEAVEARVREQMQPVMTELGLRLEEFEKTRLAQVRQESEARRKADLRDIAGAFDLLERRLSVIQLSAAKYGGD